MTRRRRAPTRVQLATVVRYVAIDGAVQLRGGFPVALNEPADVEVQTALTRAQIEGVLSLLRPAVERCEAALAVPTTLLAPLMSPSGIENLRRIGRELSPDVRERAREQRTALRVLCRVVSAKTPAAQAEEFDRHALATLTR